MFLSTCFSACAPKAAAIVDVRSPAETPKSASSPAEAALPPPTDEERDLAVRLRATVEHLSLEIGERNPARSWNLASATDDLARTLEKQGYEVRRQGIVMGEDVVQNLEAKTRGGERGAESIVVAAHFDSAPGSPGADESTGVAAIVELARLFHDRKTSRTLRFALLANGAPPHGGTEHGGSLAYGKDLVGSGARVTGALCLDGLGAFASEKGTQHATGELLGLLPDTADFVAVLGTDSGRELWDRVATSMKTGPVKVTSLLVAKDASVVRESDCGGFSLLGFPSVVVTDTGALRSVHRRAPTDLPKELDFDRMARTVSALSRALEAVTAS